MKVVPTGTSAVGNVFIVLASKDVPVQIDLVKSGIFGVGLIDTIAVKVAPGHVPESGVIV